MIQIDQVVKRFGNKIAVDGISLKIEPGEIFGMLGPNGAGKTTTIKMVTGLLKPDSGSIKVCGHDVLQDHIAAKSQLAYIPDEPYVYDKLTGREFLDFVGRMFRLNGDELPAEIERWTDRFDMSAYIDTLTESYSHGMKQRLAICGALIHRPKVIMIDEPMVGLDPVSARLVKAVLREQAKSGVSILMSTHILSIAQEVADRVGIVMGGKVVAEGSCEEICRRGEQQGTLEEAFFRIIEGGGEQPLQA